MGEVQHRTRGATPGLDQTAGAASDDRQDSVGDLLALASEHRRGRHLVVRRSCWHCRREEDLDEFLLTVRRLIDRSPPGAK